MATDKLEKNLKLTKFEIGKTEEHTLTVKTPWIAEILSSLEESLDEEDLSLIKDPANLSIELDISRKINPAYRDHLTVYGSFELLYHTPCIRCLVPTKQEINSHFSTCFIEEALIDTPEFKDQEEVIIDGQEVDLYTYKNKEIDLKELLNEQITLSLNPFPLHDEDCKGLCPTCGANLNKTNCGHL